MGGDLVPSKKQHVFAEASSFQKFYPHPPHHAYQVNQRNRSVRGTAEQNKIRISIWPIARLSLVSLSCPERKLKGPIELENMYVATGSRSVSRYSCRGQGVARVLVISDFYPPP